MAKETKATKTSRQKNFSIKQISNVGLFLAVLIICSKITVPTPAISFTLQTMAVSFIALYLGPELGALTQTLFLVLGLAGLPVFSGGGGLAYVFKPSFGYLVAFIPASYVIGKLFQRFAKRTPQKLFAAALPASLVGLLIIYTIGTLYFYILGHLYLGLGAKPWTWFAVSGALMFLPTDLLQMAVASFIVSRVRVLRPSWLKTASA